MIKAWQRFILRWRDNRKYACHRPFLNGKDQKPDHVKVLDSYAYGATMNWSYMPVREHRFKYLCKICGETFCMGGFSIFRDRDYTQRRITARGGR